MKALLNDGPLCGRVETLWDTTQSFFVPVVNPAHASESMMRFAEGRAAYRPHPKWDGETQEVWLDDATGEWCPAPCQLLQVEYRRTDRVSPDGFTVFDYEATREPA